MKKGNDSYFVIKSKSDNKYVTNNWGGCTNDNWYGYTNVISDALSFKTDTKAYNYMREHFLDEKCIVIEVKE